jgi:hypothetical protein
MSVVSRDGPEYFRFSERLGLKACIVEKKLLPPHPTIKDMEAR